MRRLTNTFFAGLAAVLPVSITLYLIFWLGSTSESVLGDLMKFLLPDSWYRPGLGIVTGFLVVMLVGFLINAYAVRWLVKRGEELLLHVPVVKTIYSAVKDFTRFLPSNNTRRDLQRVVMWKVGTGNVIGFVTSEQLPEQVIAAAQHATDLVAVYFPLSYQLGGHTLFISRHELIETHLQVEQALRLVLTGGITTVPPEQDSTQHSS